MKKRDRENINPEEVNKKQQTAGNTGFNGISASSEQPSTAEKVLTLVPQTKVQIATQNLLKFVQGDNKKFQNQI